MSFSKSHWNQRQDEPSQGPTNEHCGRVITGNITAGALSAVTLETFLSRDVLFWR